LAWHPVGAKGIDEAATSGSPPAMVHADMPWTPANVWLAIQGSPVRTDLSLS
jgi:aerobic carbon-monoxide dehydrogenase large subunit